jgi:signal peptide peptidase SppA
MSTMDSLKGRVIEKLPDAVAGRTEKSRVVAVVKLQGMITASHTPLPRGTISYPAVESAVKRAFEHDRLAAVALEINSPGGAATQSALIAERIRGLAAEKGVEVLAFCEDVAASGGYWLACAGDEIYAHQTSMVGSIGVISAGFGLEGLLDRFGVERRVHTAGKNKMRLDPFRPEKPEDVRWLRGLQDQLHEQFVAWVRQRRDGKLADGVDGSDELFTGEVFLGARAKELGLVDGLGTLRGVVAERFPDARVVVAEPRKPLLARLGLSAPGLAAAGIDALEARSAWSRFGL